MAKRKSDAGFAVVILFIIASPLLCNLLSGKALTYIFTAAAFFAGARRVSDKQTLAVSKVQLCAYAAALYSTLQLIFVSDKGSQFYFAITLWFAAVMMQNIANAVSEFPKKDILSAMRTAAFAASIIYAFVNVLYQIFIADGFFAYKMDFASGSSYFSAILSFVGLLCAISLYEGRKKSFLFYAAAALLCYAFLFSRSSLGFLTASAIAFEYASRKNKKPAQKILSAAALAVSIIWKIASVTRQAASLSAPVRAALYGAASIFGVGRGGYDASFSALGQDLSVPPPTIAALIECAGIIGAAIAVGGAVHTLCLYFKKRRTANFTACAIYISSLFASFGHFIPLAILLCIYLGCVCECRKLKASRVLMVFSSLAGAFAIYLAAARIPFAVGDWANEGENYALAAKSYTMGANAEIFDSSSWVSAARITQSLEENESDVVLCYEKAIAFNKQSLDIRIELAEFLSQNGKSGDALDIWKEIMQMCDNELLYVRYAEKVYSVMEESTYDPNKERELYDLIAACAEKCGDTQIRTEVNDILSRAQKYLVASIDGEMLPGDLYEEYDEATEFASEEETE